MMMEQAIELTIPPNDDSNYWTHAAGIWSFHVNVFDIFDLIQMHSIFIILIEIHN